MIKDNEFCICENNQGVYPIQGEWGFWLHCSVCNKKMEDGFHYYDEPEDCY